MNPVVLTLRRLWRILFYINGAAFFIVLFPFFYLFLSHKKGFKAAMWLKRIWGRLIIHNVGIFFSLKKESVLDKKGVYVFCPNHSSYLDITFVYLIIPVYFHIVGKAELLKVPLFRRFFRKMNIPVNRNSLRSSHAAFLRAGQDLASGTSITIFPEGTIPDTTPKLGRFKNGPFRLAIESQVPVVPITFLNNWKLLPEGRRKKRGGMPGISRIVMHKPIPTKGMTLDNLESLKFEVFNIINNCLKEYESR